MARGLWKGAISFGLVNVPVELHSAKKKSAELDMTMLDKRDLAPVGYKRVNKATGKEVAWGDVVKGYEYKDDKYVVLSDEDFRRANPEAAKTVDILAFVELSEIQPQYFDTPYYLEPEKRGEKAYALLRDTLDKAGKAGIASVVIRTKQYLAALVAQGRRTARLMRMTNPVGCALRELAVRAIPVAPLMRLMVRVNRRAGTDVRG